LCKSLSKIGGNVGTLIKIDNYDNYYVFFMDVGGIVTNYSFNLLEYAHKKDINLIILDKVLKHIISNFQRSEYIY